MTNIIQKEDLTQYGNAELSLRVFNEEFLYRRRHSANFDKLLDQLFVYTLPQMHELIVDLKADKAEQK